MLVIITGIIYLINVIFNSLKMLILKYRLYISKIGNGEGKVEGGMEERGGKRELLYMYVSLCFTCHRTKEYEEKVQSLSKELENVGLRLEASEKQSREPPPLLLRLQEDMKAMKVNIITLYFLTSSFLFLFLSFLFN